MQSLNDILAGQLVPRFAGEIWESDATVPMGMGYAKDVQGKPFDIESAQYLKPVFRAIRNPTKRKIVLRGAVQTLKTFVVEKSAIYFARHDPGDMTFYDCDLEAAIDHAKTRMGPLLKSIPGLAAQFEEVLKSNRFDITTTEFILPGMTLRLWPLNLSSTQRMTLRYVCISDAFLSKNTGLLEQAIARTTQHLLDKKVIIESQGSDEDDDFDRQFNDTDQASLWVNCPLCGAAQEFVWEARRDDGTFAGMQRGPDELVKLPEGGYDAQAVLEHTHYECLHCRGRWDDTPAIREAVDHSSHYVAANPTANPENAGFMWPRWINRRLGWGETMLKYLVAKQAHTTFGNIDPIRQWYQKCAARTWSERLVQKKISILSQSHAGLSPEDWAALLLSVDCQQGDVAGKTGKFWWELRAIGHNRKIIAQLDRGFADSWQEWWDVQERFKVENENVGIDCGNYLDEILDAAAARHRWVWRDILNPDGTRSGQQTKTSSVWKLLRGNGLRNSFPWGERQARAFSKPIWHQRRIPYDGGHAAIIKIPVYEWSNLSVKDHFYRLLTGGANMPEFRALPHDKLTPKNQEKERGDLIYETQLQNQYRVRERNRDKWIETSPNVHYADTGCQCVVLLDMGGFLGLPTVPDTSDSI